MKRMEMINAMIEAHGYKRYLEIGAQTGKCFEQIKCEEKVCLDVRKGFDGLTYKMSSDDFFLEVAGIIDKFDIIFIDGLHVKAQVIKDIKNSMKHLNEGGVIMMHDCNPTKEEHQTVPATVSNWTGDVWRAFLYYRLRKPEWEMFVVNSDWGVGVIQKGVTPTHTILEGIDDNITYKEFAEKRVEILNLISPEEFMNKLIEE